MNKPLAFLALIFLIGGIGLGIVALATSNWSEKDEASIGFFQRCFRSTYRTVPETFCTNNLDKDHRDEFKDDSESQYRFSLF